MAVRIEMAKRVVRILRPSGLLSFVERIMAMETGVHHEGVLFGALMVRDMLQSQVVLGQSRRC